MSEMLLHLVNSISYEVYVISRTFDRPDYKLILSGQLFQSREKEKRCNVHTSTASTEAANRFFSTNDAYQDPFVNIGLT